MTKTVLILNGPGLADLDARDPANGGDLSLGETREDCAALCRKLGLALEFRQSDDDDEFLRCISEDSRECDGMIINPGRHSETGDASVDRYHYLLRLVAGLEIPVIEVHLRNVFRDDARGERLPREEQRSRGLVCGMGRHGYLLAIEAMARELASQQ